MKRKLLDRQRRRAAINRLRGTDKPNALSAPASASPVAKNIRLPICFSDLRDRVPTEVEVDEIVTTFERTPTLLMLAMLNTFLSFYQHYHDDREAFTFVQGFLFQNLTDEETFELARRRFPNDQMGVRPMFHRQQMLVLLKKILLLSNEDAPNDPNDGSNKKARYGLGKLALMANDLLNPPEQGERLERKDDTEQDRERRYDEFVTQMLPMYELSNPAEVMPALVRNDEYFNVFEAGTKDGKFRLIDGDSIAERFRKLTQLDLKDYLLMIMSVFWVLRGHVASGWGSQDADRKTADF